MNRRKKAAKQAKRPKAVAKDTQKPGLGRTAELGKISVVAKVPAPMQLIVPRRVTSKATRLAALRDELWPDAPDVIFKAGRDSGYCKMVPRIVPLVASVADWMAPKKAGQLTSTYVELWLRTDDDSFVEIRDEYEHAAGAGYISKRAIGTWRERIRELERLGLIRVRGEEPRPIKYILLLNPVEAVRKALTGDGGKLVPAALRNAVRNRLRESGNSTEGI